MLGQLSGENEADCSLDLAGCHGGLLVVEGKACSLSRHLKSRGGKSQRRHGRGAKPKELTLSKISLMKEFMMPIAYVRIGGRGKSKHLLRSNEAWRPVLLPP